MATFNVRIFGYAGLVEIGKLLPRQFSGSSIIINDEPCLWSQVVAVTQNSGVAIASVVQPNDLATFAVIEVPDGMGIRYEVQPNGPNAGNARVAGNASRRMNGSEVIAWGAGYTVSMVDLAAFP